VEVRVLSAAPFIVDVLPCPLVEEPAAFGERERASYGSLVSCAGMPTGDEKPSKEPRFNSPAA
jgi:hypothetical protein